MSLSKRVLIAVPCLVVVALPLAASKPSGDTYRGTAVLQAVTNSDEPNASGVATGSYTLGYYGGALRTQGHRSVSCAGLTPGSTYIVGRFLGSAKASGNGNLQVRGSWSYHDDGGPLVSIAVIRVEPSRLVAVLYGEMAYVPAK